jgi:hypothetical protein
MVFFGASLYLFGRGVYYMLGYPILYENIKRFGELPGVTPEDVERLESLVPLALFAMRLALVFGLVLLFYAGWAVLSLLLIYGRFMKDVKGVAEGAEGRVRGVRI